MLPSTVTSTVVGSGFGDQHYHHLHGPIGDLIVSLDLLDAGLLGAVTRMTVVRRHAAACVLSHIGKAALIRHRTEFLAFSDELATLVPVARDLRRQKPSDLLRKYLAYFEGGLLGALGKIGPRLQPPEFYRALAGLFQGDDPAKRQMAAVVRKLSRLDAERLDIILALEPEPTFLTPRWIEKLGSVQEAMDTVAVARLLRN